MFTLEKQSKGKSGKGRAVSPTRFISCIVYYSYMRICGPEDADSNFHRNVYAF